MSRLVKNHRRGFLKTAVGTMTAVALQSAAAAQYCSVEEGTVRDHLWVFNCPPNTDYGSMQRRSVMTPAEFAFFLGVPNIIMVQASAKEARYGRFEPPFDQYALALRPLKRVIWSIVGSGGFSDERETEEVLELAEKTPNFVGIMLDDFFKGKNSDERAVLGLDELRDIRRRLQAGSKKLEIFVTLYYSQLDLALQDYLELVDVITLWGGPSDLEHLDTNMAKVEKRAPRSKKMLGCYLADYGKAEGLPLHLMKLQCETGLQWLQEGRIEGMVFLGNTLADLGFQSVGWTRKWIEKVGELKV